MDGKGKELTGQIDGRRFTPQGVLLTYDKAASWNFTCPRRVLVGERDRAGLWVMNVM